MRATRRLGAVVLLAAIASGCTSGGDSGSKPSSKLPSDTNPATATAAHTSSSPTASPSTAEPTPPALISQQTPAGAKATADYFVQTLNAVYNGKPQATADLSAPACEYCKHVVGDMRTLLASGGRSVLVSRYEVRSSSRNKFSPSLAAYDVAVLSGQNRFFDGRTHKWAMGDARMRATIRISLAWHSKGWLVTSVARVVSGGGQ